MVSLLLQRFCRSLLLRLCELGVLYETFLLYLLRPDPLRSAAGGEVLLRRIDQLLLFAIR
jgi:hypothetical protein